MAVGKGLDDPEDAPRRISWLCLYSPTSLEGWTLQLSFGTLNEGQHRG